MFDVNSADSIINYAKKLKGKTLREACTKEIEVHGYKGKGNFGQILEKFYFGYEPNSDSEPDFKEVGLELKSSSLKTLKNGSIRSKERLVLNIINYLEVHKQTFDNSSFWKKNGHLLLVFHLYNQDADLLDYLIMLVDGWQFPSQDLEVIKNDWETINQKIKDGKAHELSEGDTFYLGACTKGGKGGNARQQPFNDIPAKQRAYSLKQGYVNHIIANISKHETEAFGKLIPSLEVASTKTIEEIVQEKFAALIGKSDKELVATFGLQGISTNPKHYHSLVSKAIIDSVFDVPRHLSVEDYIEEFSKADISIKTVRLNEENTPYQDTSLPAFNYVDIYNGSWRNSELKKYVERKYLFVFFKHKDGILFLDKVKFWNMSVNDIKSANLIWLNLKKLIINGTIVKGIVKNKNGVESRRTFFPKIKTNNIHIRPHGSTTEDTYPLPVEEKFLKSMEYTKHSFWFNKPYVRDEIYLK